MTLEFLPLYLTQHWNLFPFSHQTDSDLISLVEESGRMPKTTTNQCSKIRAVNLGGQVKLDPTQI
jgi:hypothetical protein